MVVTGRVDRTRSEPHSHERSETVKYVKLEELIVFVTIREFSLVGCTIPNPKISIAEMETSELLNVVSSIVGLFFAIILLSKKNILIVSCDVNIYSACSFY